MSKITLKARDLDGYLTKEDNDILEEMNKNYQEVMKTFHTYSTSQSVEKREKSLQDLIDFFNKIGRRMQEITNMEKRIHVYSFETPESIHGEASRLISKLRDVRTQQPEFIYYIQRAYELLFNFAFASPPRKKKNYIIVKTPVDIPVQNYAVHKVPNIDEMVTDSVMCVMLRGALLPSMILSKEIQEYSSNNYITPFALFKIYRDDTKERNNMEYTLDLSRSYFNLKELDGKSLFFADPMNATGGSLITIVKYLLDQGIRPKSIKFFNVVSVLRGSLRIVRAFENAEIFTLWIDPALNQKAYIMPGLGDAGDRINGRDEKDMPRDIIQLIADYGANIASLYRDQLRKIERTVLEHRGIS